MRRNGTGLVLAYHGCSPKVAEDLLRGVPFKTSRNAYDWLGWGAYFWESDPERARQWAALMQSRNKSTEEPAPTDEIQAEQSTAVGAVIDLGFCLDLTTQASLEVIKTAYSELNALAKKAGETLLANTDGFRRERDCAVLNYLYASMPEPKFQTVRGVFTEGGPLFDGACIQAKTHIQIAVRDLTCIKGVFKVL